MCFCGKESEYNKCCGEIISGLRVANSAEELMRSRYSAFAVADGDYLMKSHHPKTRPEKDKKAIEQWARSVKWIGLSIISTNNGKKGDNNGTVEFKALYMEGGKLEQIHEKSEFVKEQDLWYYVSGEHYI